MAFVDRLVSRTQLARSRPGQVVALLSASFALTALVTYEAQDAAREQKDLAYRAIRAETAAAADRFAAAALGDDFAGAWRRVGPLLRPLPGGSADGTVHGQPNDSLLSVVVTGAGGAVLFRSAPAYASDFHGESSRALAPFVVRATLRPGVANLLLAERLPTCRLALLLSFLGANALLLVLAVVHLRHERALARLRSDFVSGVSHELRTPLAQIRMFAETMLLDRMDRAEDRRRALQVITKESARLATLIENILHFSRAERQATVLRREPVALTAVAADVIEGYRPLAAARGASVRLREAGAAEAIVEVDRAAVRQILLNLLDNAVKYGPAGQTVAVEVGVVDGRARLAVSDAGPGVPAAEHHRVWEPFYRLERDRRSATGGSGIGLAVVRQLAEAHGGRAWIAAGAAGTRVEVELGPVVAAAAPALAGAGQAEPAW